MCYNIDNMIHPTGELVQELAHYAQAEVNEQLGAPHFTDQSAGNQCHQMTHIVAAALSNRGHEVGRELHRDDEGNWHYLIRHTAADATPTDADLITDFNPWQWANGLSRGKGLLHAPRAEVMETLHEVGAPDFFIALRSLKTIVKAHESDLNFGGHVR